MDSELSGGTAFRSQPWQSYDTDVPRCNKRVASLPRAFNKSCHYAPWVNGCRAYRSTGLLKVGAVLLKLISVHHYLL